MKKIIKNTVILLTLSTAAFSASCTVEERHAEKNGVQAQELETFPFTTRQVLSNDKFLMWKEHVTADEASIVIHSGAVLDYYEELAVSIRSQAPSDPEERDRYNQEHEEELSQIESVTEESLNSIVENCDFFMNQPQRVMFFRNSTGYGVSIVGWEFESYSTEAQDDAQQRIYDVSYEEYGGTWRFKVRRGPQIFGIDADYYEFRVSRTRLSITDGRIFYQGDVIAKRDGKVIRRGQAKIYAG